MRCGSVIVISTALHFLRSFVLQVITLIRLIVIEELNSGVYYSRLVFGIIIFATMFYFV